jgi:hypothetical protein
VEEKGVEGHQAVVGFGLEARWVEVGLRLNAGDLQGGDGVQDIDENLERLTVLAREVGLRHAKVVVVEVYVDFSGFLA